MADIDSGTGGWSWFQRYASNKVGAGGKGLPGGQGGGGGQSAAPESVNASPAIGGGSAFVKSYLSQQGQAASGLTGQQYQVMQEAGGADAGVGGAFQNSGPAPIVGEMDDIADFGGGFGGM